MKRFLSALALGLTSGWALLAADVEPGFESLFNGKDLSGWEGNSKFWSVSDGAITGQTTKDNPTPRNTFIIYRGGEVSDFELRLSYRIVGGNSGIQYRSKVLDRGQWVVGGYQADFEAGTRYSGILYDEAGGAGGRGIMAERGQRVRWTPEGTKEVIGQVGDSQAIQAAIKSEGWNDYVIIAQGTRLTHKINGLTTVEVIDETEGKRLTSGVLAFQVHQGPPMRVQFKNIRIKKLP